jgi:hypothetical protein
MRCDAIPALIASCVAFDLIGNRNNLMQKPMA